MRDDVADANHRIAGFPGAGNEVLCRRSDLRWRKSGRLTRRNMDHRSAVDRPCPIEVLQPVDWLGHQTRIVLAIDRSFLRSRAHGGRPNDEKVARIRSYRCELSHTMTRAGANERDTDLAKVCRGAGARVRPLGLVPIPR